MFKDQRGRCLICNKKKWLNKPIPLEYDHIDGVHGNNARSNSRLVCPNCHVSTETYRGRNINKGSKHISDKKLLRALLKCSSKRAALLSVGLAGCGANYLRCYKLLQK